SPVERAAPPVEPGAALRKPRGRMSAEARAAWLFLLPALLVLTVFFFLPVVAALLLSLTDFDIYAIANGDYMRVVGLRNYVDLINDPLFWTALKSTFYFVLVGGPISVATFLGAAILLNAKALRFKGFFRPAYFAPVATTLVAVAVVWRFLFHTRYGLI